MKSKQQAMMEMCKAALPSEKEELEIFGREHLKVNAITQYEIIKRYNMHEELISCLKRISDAHDPYESGYGMTNGIFTEVDKLLKRIEQK